jgi:phage-related protein
MPLVGAIGGGLWEVRSTHDKVEYRVLFAVVGKRVVALHGFVKKTKKTSKGDLGTAVNRLAEILVEEKYVKKTTTTTKKKAK